MSVSSRLVGFDRKTERAVFQHDVPRALMGEVLKIAGLTVAEERLGDIELQPDRAEKIAKLLDTRIDTKRCDFFLEMSAPAVPGRRATRA